MYSKHVAAPEHVEPKTAMQNVPATQLGQTFSVQLHHKTEKSLLRLRCSGMRLCDFAG